MTRFHLVFRQDGEADKSEYRYNNSDGEPQIDGKLIVDGHAYVIRGVEWLLRREDSNPAMARFVCTLVVEPIDE